MVLGLLLVFGFLWWMSGPPGMASGMHGGPFFWGWLPFLFLWLGGMRLLRGARYQASHHRRAFTAPVAEADPALATLRERFARGEIDRAEYEERRAILLGRQAASRHDTGVGEGDKPEWPDLV